MDAIKTNGSSKIYRRETIDSLAPTSSASLRYWRAAAKKIFAAHPEINAVECVTDGCETSSQIIGERGDYYVPTGWHVIIASTGGRFGKPRREFSAKK